MTDPTLYLGATSQEVRDHDRDGRPARVVVAGRTYPTSPDDLWDALTQPARIARWFLPISGDLRLGGRYQLEGQAGGTITACEPPRYLAATWEFQGTVTWITVTVAPDGEGARLTLEHIHPYEVETWPKYGPGAVGVGWDLTFMGLGRHIGGDLDPAEAQAWVGTAEGKAFMRASSEAWLAAWIAAGAEPQAARRAAAQTTAFYLGEPPPQ